MIETKKKVHLAIVPEEDCDYLGKDDILNLINAIHVHSKFRIRLKPVQNIVPRHYWTLEIIE